MAHELDLKHAIARKRQGPAILFLNDQPVGEVQVTGGDFSWGFGRFVPSPEFAQFAPLYGTWSVLMHAEDDQSKLSRDAAAELARAEALIDSVKARLRFLNEDQHVHIAQLTIDGDRLEWKEF
jgi:hypothetical protein